MTTRQRLLIITLIMLSITGCSFLSDEEKITLPAQPALTQTAKVTDLWHASPISGDTKQYNKFSPALAGNEILVADDKGHLAVVDKSSGKTKWRYSSKANFSSSAEKGDGKVYIGTEDATVLAIDNASGKLAWQQKVTDQVVGSPAYTNGIVIIKTLDGKLSGLNSNDGSTIWAYNENNPELVLKGESAPVIVGDKVIAGFPDGKLIVLNVTTGAYIWSAQVAESSGFSTLARMIDINTTPVVSDGLLYVGTYQGNISAYAIATGHRIWEHQLSTYSGLTVDSQNVYVTDADGVLWAFDKNSGAVNWKQAALKQYMLTEPLAYKKYVLVGDNVGNLQVFIKRDGQAAARVKISNKPIYAAPITDGKSVFVLGTDGQLTALTVS